VPRPVERFLIMCIACYPIHYALGKEPTTEAGFLEYLGQMVEEDGE